MNRTSKTVHALMACGFLSWAGPASADAVTDWNEVTVAAVTLGRPGPIGQMDIALVQIAVHDAVQAIERRLSRITRSSDKLRQALGCRGRSRARRARRHVSRAGAQSIDPTYFAYLADNGLTDDPGLTVGQQAAASILPLRRVNPNPFPPPFVGSTRSLPGDPTPSFLGNPPLPPGVAHGWRRGWRIRSLHAHEPDALPRRSAAGADERALYAGLRRSQSPRGALATQAHAGADRLAYFWTDNFFAQ